MDPATLIKVAAMIGERVIPLGAATAATLETVAAIMEAPARDANGDPRSPAAIAAECAEARRHFATVEQRADAEIAKLS
jgi:hypothetical protein